MIHLKLSIISLLKQKMKLNKNLDQSKEDKIIINQIFIDQLKNIMEIKMNL